MGASDNDDEVLARGTLAGDQSGNEMLAADPFSDVDPNDGPRLSPMATPQERKALLGELRGLIQAGQYEVDPEIVAVAVMREGRWERR